MENECLNSEKRSSQEWFLNSSQNQRIRQSSYKLQTANGSILPHDATFQFFMSTSLNPQGWLCHWLTVPLQNSKYVHGPSDEATLCRDAIDSKIAPAPQQVINGEPGPLGGNWSYFPQGRNVFVEHEAFYFDLRQLEFWTATSLILQGEQAQSVSARFWARGTADLYLNGQHLTRLVGPRRTGAQVEDVELKLNPGPNLIVCRVQVLGLRNTQALIGLQVCEHLEHLEVTLPGGEEVSREVGRVEQWLESIDEPRSDCSSTLLVSSLPAPVDAVVKDSHANSRMLGNWPAGDREFDAGKEVSVLIELEVAGSLIHRTLERPRVIDISEPPAIPLEDHRRQLLLKNQESREVNNLALSVRPLARWLLGDKNSVPDQEDIDRMCNMVATRQDCADFSFSVLLRYVALGAGTDEQRNQIREVALGFRYWPDEPGSDTMCFTSENHALLFHSCQAIAARLWPDEVFTCSGRKSSQQYQVALEHLQQWMQRAHPSGLAEFQSGNYMAIVFAGLLNVLDLVGDDACAETARHLLDEQFRFMARHVFDGVTISPQGRVYRNVLYPHWSTKQALLSYASTGVRTDHNIWTVFLFHSRYNPPADLDDYMKGAMEYRYAQKDVEIFIQKSSGYLLTGVDIPDSPAEGYEFIPGEEGIQEQLWQASLGADVQVFVNHPGSSYDLCSSRPGYWYGNGTLPKVKAFGNILWCLYDISVNHPVEFTHAHWPSDAFVQETLAGQWAFGETERGRIALWCSQPMERMNDVLLGRELRASGRRVAWMCLCADIEEDLNGTAFQERCRSLDPKWDVQKMTARWADSCLCAYTSA
jgi:hypothetical protein